MSGLNLSEWALKHRSFIVFIMLAATLGGLASYFRLGRAEDPPFTFRTMIVQAAWPGATMDETLQQVTERIERKLQETRGLDFLRSYTKPGLATIFVNLKGSTKASEVPDIWYQVRKNVGDIRNTLPTGVIGPGFNDDFGDTYGLIYGFTADGFTHRELRDDVEGIRSKLLQVPDVSKIELLGAQDEQIFVEFSTQQLAGLGIDRAALIAALHAQNAVVPSGSLQTGDETLLIRVSGAFRSENDILDVNFLSNGRLIRLRDIAQVRRALADPPQPMFRVNGKPAIGLAIAMRDGGDILALGRNVKAAVDGAMANLPLGVNASLVSDQPVVVQTAIGEFMELLWQAIAIIMAVSIISLGLRPGSVVALTIPLTIAIVFPVMAAMHIDLQRISLGALIISLSLLVDSAMTTIDVMTTRLAQGDSKEAGGGLRLPDAGLADADRHLRHHRRLRPDRLCAQRGRRIHVLDLRRGDDRAHRLLVRRGSFRAASRRRPAQGAEGRRRGEAERGDARLPHAPRRRDAGALAHRRRDARLFRRSAAGVALRAAAILSRLRPPRTRRQSDPAAKRLDLRQRTGLGQARRDAEGRSRRRQLEHLCRARRHPLLPAARRPARQRLLFAGRGHRQGRAGARSAACEAGEGARRAIAERRLPGRSAGARAAGRMAGAISGERTGHREGARDRAEARSGDGRGFESAAGQFRLDGARARSPDPDRPGSGAAPGVEFAGARRSPEWGDDGNAGDAGARRHLSRQRRRAGQ